MEPANVRPIWKVYYAVAALLIIVPLIEIAVGGWPFQPGEMAWRFGTLGILFKSLITPLIGLALVIGVAALLGHRRVARALAVLSLVVAFGIAALAVVFVLDYLQLRTTVAASMRGGVDRASLTALGMVAVVVPVGAALGVAGWVATRTQHPARLKARAAEAHQRLIISQPKESKT